MITSAQYDAIKKRVADGGYGDEIAWAQTVTAPQTPEQFAREYVWVVLNSGMKNAVARGIAKRLLPALETGRSAREVFGHPGKAAAIDSVWGRRRELWAEFMASDDQLSFCRSLPWIGDITCWHLAKNLGHDCAKPDRWLQRLAVASGETVEMLCARLSRETGDRVATVDLVLWRACSIGVIAIGSEPGSGVLLD